MWRCSLLSYVLLCYLLSVAYSFRTNSFHHRSFASKTAISGIFREKWADLKSFRRPSAIREVDPGAVEGTTLRIVKYPDPRLRQKNEFIEHIDEETIRTAKEMLLIMRAMNGAGLAAPQVGINKRLMVLAKDCMDTDCDVIAINPAITQRSKTMWCSEEGCLSFPDLWIDVDRHEWIEVEYQDMNGEKVFKRLENFASILFQHEYDHIDEVLFIDRMVPISKNSADVQDKLKKMIEDFGPNGRP